MYSLLFRPRVTFRVSNGARGDHGSVFIIHGVGTGELDGAAIRAVHRVNGNAQGLARPLDNDFGRDVHAGVESLRIIHLDRDRIGGDAVGGGAVDVDFVHPVR